MPDLSRLRHHFDTLCSFGGRLSGTPGEEKAIAYIEAALAALDQGELVRHTVPYQGWTCREAWLEIDGVRHIVQALPGSAATNGVIEIGVVDAGRGTPDDIARLGAEIADRAVLVTHEYMFGAGHVHRSRKFDQAVRLGAGAFVIANPWPDSGLVSGGTSFGEQHSMPSMGVSRETGKALRMAAKSNAKVRLMIDAETRPATALTLDWSLPAAPGQREFVVSAHVDGHAPAESAIDNASGCAVALEIAAAAARSAPKGYGLRVLFFSIEEWGLLASKAYVDAMSADDRRRMALVVNLDSIAGDDKLTAMISGYDDLRELVEDAAAATGLDIGIHEPLVRNSDHFNFASAGIPAMRLIAGFDDMSSNLRHVLTSADRAELVDTRQLENAFRITARLCGISPIRK